MSLRKLLEMIGNHPQVIQRLAESKPIKRAAQITVGIFNQMKEMGQANIDEKNKKIEIPNGTKTIRSIMNRFQENLDKEMKERERKRRDR